MMEMMRTPKVENQRQILADSAEQEYSSIAILQPQHFKGNKERKGNKGSKGNKGKKKGSKVNKRTNFNISHTSVSEFRESSSDIMMKMSGGNGIKGLQ